MATEVTIPQLGESVTEATITAWLVEVGQTVEADQPLFELSSDKIDTEVPSPASGVLKEIKVQVDDTVEVGTVVAIIGEADEAAGDGAGAPLEEAAEAEQEPAQAQEGEAAASTAERESVADEGDDQEAARTTAPEPAERQPAATAGAQPAPAEEEAPSAAPAGDGGDGRLMSPLVRGMVREHGLDVSKITGTGEGGRITREDVEAAISGAGGGQAAPAAAPAPAAPAPAEQAPAAQQAPAGAPARQPALPTPERRPTPQAGERVRVEDLSRIRQRIAAKMMESMSSAAQLTTVQEVDLTAIMRLRQRVKDEFKAREGVSLSPFVFLCRAAVLAIRNHPVINAFADWEAGKVTYHEYVNLGIAVDTERGLLVPNVKGADDLNLAGLARAINEAAAKARGKGKLEMHDIEGGTFTVTNIGSVGVLIDTPILNYPEVAILGTGAVRKRPMVLEGENGATIAIRDMAHLCLTYDHRLIDGADAARYVSEVRQVAETHDWAGEIGYGA